MILVEVRICDTFVLWKGDSRQNIHIWKLKRFQFFWIILTKNIVAVVSLFVFGQDLWLLKPKLMQILDIMKLVCQLDTVGGLEAGVSIGCLPH